MEQKIDVLIIEDDFWIAGIHKDLVEQNPIVPCSAYSQIQ